MIPVLKSIYYFIDCEQVYKSIMVNKLKQYFYNDHSCLMLFHVPYIIVCVYVIICFFTIANKLFYFVVITLISYTTSNNFIYLVKNEIVY